MGVKMGVAEEETCLGNDVGPRPRLISRGRVGHGDARVRPLRLEGTTTFP